MKVTLVPKGSGTRPRVDLEPTKLECLYSSEVLQSRARVLQAAAKWLERELIESD